ncbi:MAG: class II aldolase/adducin family protein [Candidatus Hodarchaeales archaeon]|jgi:L-fuculose-phosphate aldolase
MSRLEELKADLCQVMRILYTEKILTDIGGNLSIRDPEDEDNIWITPSGIQKDQVQPKHLIKMSIIDGEVIHNPTDSGPSIESPMHIAIFEDDDNVEAVIHSHAPYTTSYSLLKDPPNIPRITHELSLLIPEIIVVPYAKSGSKELGTIVAENLDYGIVILENHGAVAAAETMQYCVHKTRALEELLRLYLIARQFGGDIRPFPE